MQKCFVLTKADEETISKYATKFKDYFATCAKRLTSDNTLDCDACMMISKLFETGYEYVSSSFISGDKVVTFFRLHLNEFDSFEETKPFIYATTLNDDYVYCPDSGKKPEGFTYHKRVNDMNMKVIKWRDGDLSINAYDRLNLIAVLFKHRMLGLNVRIKFALIDNHIMPIDYYIETTLYDRRILREHESNYTLCSTCYRKDLDKLVERRNCICKPLKECETLYDIGFCFIGYLETFMSNVVNEFAVRAFDAEDKHGALSIDAKHEHDIALNLLRLCRDAKCGSERENNIEKAAITVTNDIERMLMDFDAKNPVTKE